MPRRSILTERQRLALFDLPTDDASMMRHYILADDDIEHISERRRPANRIGFAEQLCALRYLSFQSRITISTGYCLPTKQP